MGYSDLKLLMKGTDLRIGKIVSLFSFIFFISILPSGLKYIWPHQQLVSDLFLYISILVLGNLLVIIVYNSVMYYIYKSKVEFFQQYRISNRPWPWESDPSKWKQILPKTIKIVLFHLFIVTPTLALFQYKTGGMLYKSSLKQWPTTFTVLWQFVFFMIVQDFLFYWSHRLLHHPRFYWLHKKHHQYNVTISLAVTYAHPLQYIISDALPSGLGYHILAKFTSVHYVTIFSWIVFRLIETCEGHSGYKWSWGQLSFLPWKQGPEYHDFHHSHNVGNYGSLFPFWDTFMETNNSYLKFITAKQMQSKEMSND